MQAQDVMTTQVVTVEPSTSVHEIAKLMTEHRIGGVPAEAIPGTTGFEDHLARLRGLFVTY